MEKLYSVRLLEGTVHTNENKHIFSNLRDVQTYHCAMCGFVSDVVCRVSLSVGTVMIQNKACVTYKQRAAVVNQLIPMYFDFRLICLSSI